MKQKKTNIPDKKNKHSILFMNDHKNFAHLNLTAFERAKLIRRSKQEKQSAAMSESDVNIQQMRVPAVVNGKPQDKKQGSHSLSEVRFFKSHQK